MFCYIAKVTFIGDSRSGKTSLIKRYQENSFSQVPISTVGVDFSIREIEQSPPNHPLKLQIWDTAGQERFNSVVQLYFRNSYAIVLAFDLTNKSSFNNLNRWIKLVREEYEPELFIIVGNKSDLSKPAITRTDVYHKLIHIEPKIKFKYLETSAKNNKNVDKIFTTITDHINQALTTDPPSIKQHTSLRKAERANSPVQVATTAIQSTFPNCCN